MTERYKIVEGSESNHCCFSSTIVDTQRPIQSSQREQQYEIMCECFERADAELICEALNQFDLEYTRSQTKDTPT